MKRIRILTLFVAVTAVFVATVSFAQQGRQADAMGFDNQSGRGNASSEEKREAVRKKIETVKIWRLTEALKLDPNAAAKLSAFLSSFDARRRDITHAQMADMKELRSSLKSPKPAEAKLRAILEKLEKNHHEMQDLRDREWKGLKEMLTVEQQARYLIFQLDFQREMRDMIAGARRTGGPVRGHLDRRPANDGSDEFPEDR